MAIELPKSTEFNKKIPKQKFYENLEISPALKKIFIEQVDKILWSYKIASSSTNLADGNLVKEIEVFEVFLKSPNLDNELLRHIDRAVPYHIVFILEYQGRYKACNSSFCSDLATESLRLSSEAIFCNVSPAIWRTKFS